MDRSTGTTYTFAGQTKSGTQAYGADSRKGTVNLPTGGTVTRAYDALGRESATDINPVKGADPALRTQRAFVAVSGNKTTTLAETVSNYRRVNGVNTTLSSYRYTYDADGNIQTVTDAGGKVATYTYDQQNQLVRADDQGSGVSTVYTYDAGGNITAVKTYAYTTGELGAQTGENSYSYENDNWKDLLTGYDGQAISYDEIGNPLSYRDGMEFTWEGHQLETASVGGKSVSFTYNSDGIRTGKTVHGVTTSYFLDGSTMIAQKTGDDVLWFLYDGDGTRVGFTYNGTAYYYTANAQGDVTGIVDKDCNTVVEYSYDAWGKLLGTTGSLADTVGKVNPFLYRGYYYDAETGLYYLNSRYYDPQTGRFLNADGEIGSDLPGKNLFSYCGNNPTSRIDSDGHSWFSVALACLAVTVVCAAVIVAAPALAAAAAGAGIIMLASSIATAATVVGMMASTVGLYASGVAAAQSISSSISRSSSQARSRDAGKTIAKTQNKKVKETSIYRWGNYTNKNLTPKIKNGVPENSLSFSLTKPINQKYVETTMEAVNATGVLQAQIDGIDHVSVTPKIPGTMADWVASRDTADINPHPYTSVLKSICWAPEK